MPETHELHRSSSAVPSSSGSSVVVLVAVLAAKTYFKPPDFDPVGDLQDRGGVAAAAVIDLPSFGQERVTAFLLLSPYNNSFSLSIRDLHSQLRASKGERSYQFGLWKPFVRTVCVFGRSFVPLLLVPRVVQKPT